jgi:DNA mismatch repair protein MutL
MTTRVQILPDRVANKIAAGEVVERPASVVKELVENAVDAGASRIEVELRNGGKTEIRVADDGTGMARQDALLALDRHATSKIRSAEDLDSVSSFGFRGEALPSIAAVSRFELETATREQETGTRIRVRGGEIQSVDEIARQPGTTVRVRSLFHNVPARAKFLRSAGVETRAVSETIIRVALSKLRIHFRLVSNGRELLDLPPADAVRRRVADLWGGGEAEPLLELEAGEEDLRIGGLVERPDAARGGGRRRQIFVNGRPVDDDGLVAAVDDAYRTTVAPDVRPTFFLYVSLPPDGVDVNVHPQKSEVKFRDRPDVEAAARAAVRDALSQLRSTPELGGEGPPTGEDPAVDTAPSDESVPGDAEEGSVAAEGGAPRTKQVREPRSQLALFVSGHPEDAGEDREETALRGGERVRPPELWQLHETYILASSREGLLIIDQHAAHERVLYEELMDRFAGESSGTSQRLLFPLTLRLSPAEYSVVEELEALFEKVGYDVEPFGDRTVIVHGAPNPHPYFDAERCFRDMVQELAEGSELVNSARNQHERIAKSMACQGAIKAGRTLSREEMSELFDRLFATELPGHDVHGRPTIVRLTLDELHRRFRRS